MKKIVSYYYLSYPDDLPKDKLCAATEVYVEVGDQNATPAHFDSTFAFQIYTIGYIQEQLCAKKVSFLVDRSVIIVERFEDQIIRGALESILPVIEQYGIQK